MLYRTEPLTIRTGRGQRTIPKTNLGRKERYKINQRDKTIQKKSFVEAGLRKS